MCGYICINEANEYFCVEHYDDLQDIDVHGGWTFGEELSATDFITDKLTEEEKQIIGSLTQFKIFGFDCGHYMDLVPGMPEELPLLHDGVYRTVQYVENELIRVCEHFQTKQRYIRPGLDIL